MSELENAIEASQPSDVQSAPSAEQTGEPVAHVETPTQKVEQEKEVPFNEHPRWREVQEERNYWRELALKQAQPTVSPTPQADPYAGLTPEEKVFWQKVDERAEAIAQKKIESVRPQVEQELRQTKEAVSLMAYERFQQQHPDVKPGSPEENAIAQYFQKGYTLDDAYKVVMFDKIGTQKAQQAKEVLVNKVQQKIAANVETKTISPTSNLSPKASFREMMKREMEKSGF